MTFKKLVVVEVMGDLVVAFPFGKTHLKSMAIVLYMKVLPFLAAGIWWQCGMFWQGSHSYWGWYSLTYWRYLLSVCPTKRRPKDKEESLELRLKSQRLWVLYESCICSSWVIQVLLSFNVCHEGQTSKLVYIPTITSIYLSSCTHAYTCMYIVCGPGKQCSWCVVPNRRISGNSKGDVFCNIFCTYTKNWHQCCYW